MKKIDKTNIDDIKALSFHDDYFEGLHFSESENVLTLYARKYDISINRNRNVSYHMDFIKCFGFEMTHCSPWGYSPLILDLYIADNHEEERMLQRLQDLQNAYIDSIDQPIDNDMVIEVNIVFSSGDQLKIICENIVIY